MIIDDALFIFFRRTKPEAAIDAWCSSCLGNTSYDEGRLPLCTHPDELQFYAALQTQFPHYSVDEAEYLYRYLCEGLQGECSFDKFGVFGLVAYSVKEFLVTDFQNECMCKHKCLVDFRKLSHPIDPMIFEAAFLARNDISRGIDRSIFSWPPVIRSDNIQLQHVLDRGMCENHFHIGGSSQAFLFSWICLMNKFGIARKSEFQKMNMDRSPLDILAIGERGSRDTCFLLTFKAACIRYFLYGLMQEKGSITDEQLRCILKASEAECEEIIPDIEREISAMADPECDFLPDYAMYGEIEYPETDDASDPNFTRMAIRNYERRLYRPLSGEQRFLYRLFYDIFSEKKYIKPYLDLAYAYLLIYCQIRGELVQINNRVGFGNFSLYQDRKDGFTWEYPVYDAMRNSIALQVVIANPQVRSIEGRLGPAQSPQALIDKVDNLIKLANGDDAVKGFQKFCGEEWERKVDEKLHFVLHFPKRTQWITADEDFEITNERDSKKRRNVMDGTCAILAALNIRPDIMRKISGIDACSKEIDCRPEVFSCAFRRILEYRHSLIDLPDKPLVTPRITYHAGEDFVDPIDGLRAIDEAIRFCGMTAGDRLGHALALGISCRQWYEFKDYTVLIQKQVLLDDLVWLYGKMRQYRIVDEATDDHIQKHFKKLFTDIYVNNLDIDNSFLYSCDIMDYYSSLSLRGNDPAFYINNPDGSHKKQKALNDAINENLESWRILRKSGKDYDHISNTLYHYYHFNFNMKKVSSEIILYRTPQCVINTVCELQKCMQCDISERGIAIECNPSSNYLIGTFKDYIRHPIFTFNNKGLYPAFDPRHNKSNPRISASINTDDLGIFDTSLENEYALMACALERNNDYCPEDERLPLDNIYRWLDNIRENGINQSFIRKQ